MVDTSGNFPLSSNRSPEEERAARQRAANRGATSSPGTNSDNAFMSPKWADVDKNLKPRGVGASTSQNAATAKPEARSFGAPKIAGRAGLIPQTSFANNPHMKTGATNLSGATSLKSAQSKNSAYAPQRLAQSGGVLASPGRVNGKSALRQSQTQGFSSPVRPRSGGDASINQTRQAQRGVTRTLRRSARDREQEDAPPPPKKLGGVLFYMVLGLAIADDLSDVVFTAINLALTGTGVGIPIAIFLFLLGCIITISIFILMRVYFMSHGGLHTSAKLKRLFLWFIAVPLEMIPILQLLPMSTIMFVAIAWLENRIRH